MAIIGITMNEEVDFTPDLDQDKGTDKASIFKIGTLDSRVMGKLKDEATSFSVNPNAPEDEVDVSVGQNDLYYLACRFALKGWRNVQDRAGNDIPFKTVKKNYAGRTYSTVSDDALGRIPQPVLAEIGRKIVALNDVLDGEEKN